MANYLNIAQHILTLSDCAYQNKWQVTAVDGVAVAVPAGGGLYLAHQAATLSKTLPHPGAPAAQGAANNDNFYVIPAADANHFATFFNQWNSAVGATLLREVPGCHRCWPELMLGTLRSEGVADLPTFTMGNLPGTAWLPCGFYDLQGPTPVGIAMGSIDAFTLAAINSSLAFLPVGVVLSVHCGRTSVAAACWLNAGEIVVRGPLTQPAFQVYRVVYMNKTSPAEKALPAQVTLATLPQRPYQPASLAVVQPWLNSAHQFVASVLQHTALP